MTPAANATSAQSGRIPAVLRQPMTWALAALVVGATIYVSFQAAMAARYEFWTDELFALWAGDPKIPFGQAFAERILTDSNSPLYFSLVWGAQTLAPDALTAIIWLNSLGLAPLLGLTAFLGWRTRAPATTLFVIAGFLAGAPALSYGLEARCYLLSMATCLPMAVLAAGALGERQSGRLEAFIAAGLAVLAAWLHLYGAMFAGAIGAALIAVGLFVTGRPDQTRLGFVFGVAATLGLVAWIILALPMFTGTATDGFWLPFTRASVISGFWNIKQYAVGSTAAAVMGAAFVALALLDRRLRPGAVLIAVTGVLVFALPLIVSFHTVIFAGRYFVVVTPALVALGVFLLRDTLQIAWSGREARAAGLALLGAIFLAAPVLTGHATATWHFATRWDWRGSQAVEAAIPACRAGEVRVLNESLIDPPTMGFDHYVRGRLRLVEPKTAPVRDVADIDCPVYGWAEHYLSENDNREWAQQATAAQALAAFRLTNRTGVPLAIDRRNGGLTLRRAAPGETPAP